MKAIKRTVAALLATLMLATSTSFTLAAEEYSDKEAVVVAKVNAAGIMTGTDKGFEPSKTLTRAEAAAIMVRMKGISEATVKQNAGTTLFSDVAASHWAAGYVNVASNYNIIKGVGANMFAPEKEVTVAEFYTMAIRALGAGQLVEADGTWPTNYVNFAIENDLAEDVAQVYSVPATRMSAATIVANTLEAKMWTKSSVKSNGEIEWTNKENKTIREGILKISEVEGRTITATSIKDNKGTVSSKTGETIPNEFADRCLVSAAKAGIKYTVWYNKDEVLGFWIPEEDSDAVKFADIKVDYASNKVKLTVDGEDKEYNVAVGNKTTTKFLINGVAQDDADPDEPTTVWTNLKKVAGEPLFGTAYIDKDTDKIVKVYAERYTSYGVVKEVKNNKITFEAVTGNANVSTIYIDQTDDTDYAYAVSKDGKEIDITDIEAGDVLYWYTKAPVGAEDPTTYVINVMNNTVEGKVKSLSGDKITVDGTKYTLANAAVKAAVKASSEGTFYLNSKNEVVMFKKDKESTGDFAIISSAKEVNAEEVGKTNINVKLSSLDGVMTDWLTINVDKTVEEITVTAENLSTINAAKEDSTNFAAGETAYAFNGVNYHSLANAKAAIKAYAVHGKLVKYEMKSGKVVLKAEKDSEGRADIAAFKGYKDSDRNDYVGTNVIHADKDHIARLAFVNDSTVFVELEGLKTPGTYKSSDEVTVKVISAEDLDSSVATTGFVADIDEAQNEVGVVVITAGSTIKSDKSWAYVLEVAEYSENDEDGNAKDEDKLVTVVYAGTNEKVEYTMDSTKVTLNAKDVCELNVKDGVITGVKNAQTAITSDGTVALKYLYKNYNNGTRSFANVTVVSGKVSGAGSESIRYDFADDIIVVKEKGTGTLEYSISNLSAIGEITNIEDTALFNNKLIDEIVEIVVYTEDGESEVIAITFREDE